LDGFQQVPQYGFLQRAYPRSRLFPTELIVFRIKPFVWIVNEPEA
jgi:hypothetical protein